VNRQTIVSAYRKLVEWKPRAHVGRGTFPPSASRSATPCRQRRSDSAGAPERRGGRHREAFEIPVPRLPSPAARAALAGPRRPDRHSKGLEARAVHMRRREFPVTPVG
jgi:hypothetical protein